MPSTLRYFLLPYCRYYLFFWPFTSALIGITFNFLWLSLVSLLSWYKINTQNTQMLEEPEKQELTYQARKERLGVLLKEDKKSEKDMQKGKAAVHYSCQCVSFNERSCCHVLFKVSEALLPVHYLHFVFISGYIQQFTMTPTSRPAKTVGKMSLNFKESEDSPGEDFYKVEDSVQEVDKEQAFQLRQRFSFNSGSLN